MYALFVGDVIDSTVETFRVGLVEALPKLLAGLVFVTIAYVGISLILTVVRGVLERVYPADQRLIVDFFVIVVAAFLWFGAALVLLNVVGLGGVAASLGTAAGFIGLGISYALSNMIADTVAGVYLLRDPDFNEGDVVTADGVTGTVRTIGLRKSRVRTDDGTVVLANRTVEGRWTRRDHATEA